MTPLRFLLLTAASVYPFRYMGFSSRVRLQGRIEKSRHPPKYWETDILQPKIYTIFFKRNINFLSRSPLATTYYGHNTGSDKAYPRWYNIERMARIMNEKFATNLQFYRRRMDLTQEQLAERLDVSRQSISKWEAGAAFPEMDKLMTMCEMFSCSMDTLLRGNAEIETADDELGYDSYMRRFAYVMSGGTALMFLSAPVLLVLLGFGIQVAISVVSMLAFFIAGIMVMVCAGMGDEDFRRKNPVIQPFYTADQLDVSRRRFRVSMTVFVGLLFGSALFIVGSYAFPEPANATRLVYWAVFALILTIAIVGLQLTGMLHDRYNIEQYNKNNAEKKG